MVSLVFVTLAALTLSANAPDDRSTPGPPQPRPAGRPDAAKAPPRADELYSLRARRRLASYLRLRLQELRLERLDRAADAIERRIPVDELVPLPERLPGAQP